MIDGQSKTLPPPDSGEMGRQDAVPALTIACHPDASRVGERALLPQLKAGIPLPISRNGPDFSVASSGEARPLASAYMSRQPFFLKPTEDGGLILNPALASLQLEIDEKLVSGPFPISRERLERGVPLELNRRIVLLLHLFTATGYRARNSYGFEGTSSRMAQVREEIERIADLDIPVLLRGESGTGKELAAKAIHGNSPRGHYPMISVNLGAIPANLAAAELFGATKGAYTGAATAREGFFRKADRGTLFLDEIGEAPSEIQVMLLRVLENGEFYPVGSQVAQQVDVRIIAATDADLSLLTESGKFKTPLLHRLSNYELWLPPLREHREDIPELFYYFAAQDFRDLGESSEGPTGEPQMPMVPTRLMARLLSAHWPGNVRQLRNVVRQLMVWSRGKPQLEIPERLHRLFEEPNEVDWVQSHRMEPTRSHDKPNPSPKRETAHRKPANITHDELRAAMRRCDWQPSAAAKSLGITRSSLYSLIKGVPDLRIAEDLAEGEIAACLACCDHDPAASARKLRVSVTGLRRRIRKLGLG